MSDLAFGKRPSLLVNWQFELECCVFCRRRAVHNSFRHHLRVVSESLRLHRLLGARAPVSL